MLRTIILEDNPIHRAMVVDYLRKYNQRYGGEDGLELEMETGDAAAVIAKARFRANDTVYVLDLDLGDEKLNGLDVARAIRVNDARSYIVYLSAHQEYWQSCFDTKASDFIIKPAAYPQFEQCMRGVIRDYRTIHQKKRLELTIGSCNYYIPYDTIYSFEKQRDYVLMVRDGSPLRWRETFSKLLTALPSQFVMVHQGYIINTAKIQGYDAADHTLSLANGSIVPVARSRRKSYEGFAKGGVSI